MKNTARNTIARATTRSLAAAGLLALVQQSEAAIRTWTSTTTGGADWSLADNWNGDTNIAAGDTLSFSSAPVSGGTRTTNNDLTAGTQFAGLTFGANAFTLGGNAIQLSGLTTNTGGSSTINLAITMISGGGEISSTGGTGNSNRLTIAGDIAGAGDIEIKKIGASILRFGSAAKTFSGGLNVDAGTVELTLANVLPSGSGKGNVKINTGALVSISTGNQAINGLADGASGGGTIRSASSGTKTLTVGNNDASASFSGLIENGTGAIALTKTGAGTQRLSGNNTYTGATNVGGGLLLVNGTHSGNGAYSVSSGAGLGGTGTIGTTNANVVFANGATLTPGDAGAANLTFALGTGTLNLSAMATSGLFVFDLAGDKITLTTGTLNLGTITADEFSFSGIAAGIYTLFDTNASISSVSIQSGKFDLGGGFEGEFGFANSNQDFVLTVTSSIPEPSAFAALAGLATLALAGIRRRRAA